MNENNIAKMQMFRSIVWKIVAKTTDNMSIKKLRVILPGTLPPTMGNRSKYRFIAIPPPKMLCNKVTNVLQSNYTKINVCCQISEAQDIKIIRNNKKMLTDYVNYIIIIVVMRE